MTGLLGRHDVVVSAGHSDASYDELSAAIDAGLSMFTHLGNGCPMMLPRNDNIIQRVLGLRERLTISFIADGVHVPPVALANYLRLAGIERSIVVTDAISAARQGPGNYSLGRQEIEIGEDLISRLPNSPTLMGSTATMPRMVAVLRDEIGLSEDEIRQLVLDNPRRRAGASGRFARR